MIKLWLVEGCTTKTLSIHNSCRLSWSHPPLCQLLWWPHGATEGTPLSQRVGLHASMWWQGWGHIWGEEVQCHAQSRWASVHIKLLLPQNSNLRTKVITVFCNIKCCTQTWQKLGQLTTPPLCYNRYYVTNNFLSQSLTVHYRTRELCQLILQEHSKARPHEHIKTTFPKIFIFCNPCRLSDEII